MAVLLLSMYGTYFSLLCFHCVNAITKKLTCFLGGRIAWHLIYWKSLNTCIDLLSRYELLADVLVILIYHSKGCFCCFMNGEKNYTLFINCYNG